MADIWRCETFFGVSYLILTTLLQGIQGIINCDDPNSHWNTTAGQCTCNHAYFRATHGECSPCVPCCPEDIQVVQDCVQQGLDTDICREVTACTTGAEDGMSWPTIILGMGAALLGFMALLALLLFVILHRERLQMRWRRLRDDQNENAENVVPPNTGDDRETDTSPDLTNFMPTDSNEPPNPSDSTL
ncbi:uncharacterized protein LOC144434143 [Glandiceps talaboti]